MTEISAGIWHIGNMGIFRQWARKGASDGVAGSVKRQADIALKKGHLIKSAEDFYS